MHEKRVTLGGTEGLFDSEMNFEELTIVTYIDEFDASILVSASFPQKLIKQTTVLP